MPSAEGLPDQKVFDIFLGHFMVWIELFDGTPLGDGFESIHGLTFEIDGLKTLN
jgi:hypothetical protein